MDVNCNDPFLTTLNDSPEQGRVRSVKLSQLFYADAANDVFTRESLVGKFFSILIFFGIDEINGYNLKFSLIKCCQH